jgi:carbamoyltransferase
MIVLGISETHCATAALLRDGEIIGCASEERFSRIKNDSGYPGQAVDAVLREFRISPTDIDVVALAGRRAFAREWMNRLLTDAAYVRAYYGVRLDNASDALRKRARKIASKIGLTDSAVGKRVLSESERLGMVARHLDLDRERLVVLDHHACHAAAAYFGSPFRSDPVLVLTNDNSGDGLCATASIGHGVELQCREATPSAPGSLGAFYSFITLLLGMKPGEHEFKVMGLSAYAAPTAAEQAEEALRSVFDLVEDVPCRFAWQRRGPRYRLLLEATLGLRFDAIAGGAQRFLEDALVRWTHVMRERHGGDRLALGGGVFMNVRANMRIAAQEWLRDVFIFPSCGDESNAVGAAYLGYLHLCSARGRPGTIRPFASPYLGPSIDPTEIETLVRVRNLGARYALSEHQNIEAKIADLLAAGGVVARATGRMEFGARALGNRSILANPSKGRVAGQINRMIKNRDFWMPFAPTVLREREADYLLNPKGLASPYMMLAFPTNAKRRDDILAAVHPQDGTARAHILDEAQNPGFHRVICEFETRTGIGAVLNTSLNLHGEPLVCSAADAIDTFERSGLPHLALDRWLISKRES